MKQSNFFQIIVHVLFKILLATSFRRTVQVQMNEKNRFVGNMRGLYEIKDAFSSRCCFWRESFHFLFVFVSGGELLQQSAGARRCVKALPYAV
jgi:hypothetical protein